MKKLKNIKLFEELWEPKILPDQKWARKPRTWDEKMPTRKWEPEMQKIPHYDIIDLWDIDPKSKEYQNPYEHVWPLKKFDRTPEHKIFLLNVPNEEEAVWFVINTGGYDYPRYIARITDKPSD